MGRGMGSNGAGSNGYGRPINSRCTGGSQASRINGRVDEDQDLDAQIVGFGASDGSG
jgi:hypothetical protein